MAWQSYVGAPGDVLTMKAQGLWLRQPVGVYSEQRVDTDSVVMLPPTRRDVAPIEWWTHVGNRDGPYINNLGDWQTCNADYYMKESV